MRKAGPILAGRRLKRCPTMSVQTPPRGLIRVPHHHERAVRSRSRLPRCCHEASGGATDELPDLRRARGLGDPPQGDALLVRQERQRTGPHSSSDHGLAGFPTHTSGRVRDQAGVELDLAPERLAGFVEAPEHHLGGIREFVPPAGSSGSRSPRNRRPWLAARAGNRRAASLAPPAASRFTLIAVPERLRLGLKRCP